MSFMYRQIRVWNLARKWAPMLVLAGAIATLILGVVGAETAHAGLKWSGID